MADRVPENSLLSHDLFEGVFARAGLVTDVEFFDEFPSNYLVSAARQHRWARGDWQLLPWILGRATTATGRRSRSSIHGIARWKMVDNLRRTLSPPLTLAALVAAWTMPSASAGLWTAFVVACVLIPTLMPIVGGLLAKRPGVSARSHVRTLSGDVVDAAIHAGLAFTLLAHQAWLMVDAIVRTLTRLYATRKNLLEWVTAAQAKASRELDLAGFYRQMAGGVAFAVATLVLVFAAKPEAGWIAVPFCGLWMLAPLIARWVSLPASEQASDQLSDADIASFRLTARRTWLFFETFVGPEDNGLPPDNFQDDPTPAVAHRTSPTNIGMYLLSTVTARDFGWIGTHEMVERLETTLATVNRLERYRGHLYNWYDTRDLRRLDPQYVSSVDSGNLAGHLLTLSNACRQMIDQPLPVAAALAGIGDVITLARVAAGDIGEDRRGQTLTRRHLDEALELPRDAIDPAAATPETWAARLAELTEHTQTLSDVVAAMSAERGEDEESELVTWTEAAQAGGGQPRPGPGAAAIAAAGDDVPDDRRAVRSAEPAAGGRRTTRRGAARPAAPGDRRPVDAAVPGNGIRIPVRPVPEAVLDRLPGLGRRTRSELLRPARVRGSPRQLSRDRQGRGHPGPLVPARPGADADRSWLGPDLVVRVDVRVPDAGAGDARTGQQPARADEPAGRGSADRYATELGVPWGISESGFNARDLAQAYQYSSFGVPGLGLKRGLGDDLVVAPYATALAAMIEPEAAARNFVRLSKAGARGRYGFREALDYTARRLPEGAVRRDRRELHGPPPGNGTGGPRQCRSTTGSWWSASMPTRSSRRRSCCSRSACRATWSWPGHEPRR